MGRKPKKFVIGFFAGFMAVSARAEIASVHEPEYAEAVLAFNSGQYERALKLITRLQKESPKTPEFLELQAITLKASNKPEAAAEIYRTLVQLKTRGENNKKEIAPYSFELGVIRFNERKYQQAEQYLQYAARSDFNPEASNLYLGLIGVHTQDWDKAERHLRLVSQGQLEELRAAAHFYLGQVYFQRQVPANGFGELMTARRVAQAQLDRENISAEARQMATQIVQGVNTALSPFDRNQTFTTLAFTAGYDSNVLLAPNESDAAASAATESTIKAILSGHAGIATSPLKAIQLVPSFRFSANKYFNQETLSGEFTETGLSVYVNRNTLEPVSYGVKLDASIVFQNEYNRTTEASKYRLYNTTYGIGPYLRYDKHPRWTFLAELTGNLVSYNGDADLTERLRRNGPAMGFKTTAVRKGSLRYFNPTASLEVERVDTAGEEFRSLGYGATVTNTIRQGKYQFMQSLELFRTGYGTSTTDRKDSRFDLVLSAHRKLGPNWAALSSFNYTINSSSDEDAYSYNRMTVVGGVSYVF